MTHAKPSVDLGYPTPAHGRIPAFNSAEEEAAFWDRHSFAEFDEELTRTEIRMWVKEHLRQEAEAGMSPR